jgi:hypothetical protein
MFAEQIGLLGEYAAVPRRKIPRMVIKRPVFHEVSPVGTVIDHVREVAQESRVCDALTAAILCQDWDEAIRQALLLPELTKVVESCDRDRDPSLGVTLAVYAYRVAASHGNERTQRKLLRFIEGSSVLDRVIDKALFSECIPVIPAILEEIRERLVIMLCHESLARQIWGGRTIFFDPTKNTVQGWANHPLVRKPLLMRQDLFQRHADSFARANFDWLDNELSSDAADPVVEELVAQSDVDGLSIFDSASIESIGLAIEDIIDRFGVNDTRRAIQSVLRYRARAASRIFERRSLLTAALSVVIAVHPVVSMYIIDRNGIPGNVWKQSVLLAKGILGRDVVSKNSTSNVKHWADLVGREYYDLLDDLRMGGRFDVFGVQVKNGVRQIKEWHLRTIRLTVGAVLSDHLEGFSDVAEQNLTGGGRRAERRKGGGTASPRASDLVRALRKVSKSVKADRASLVVCETDLGPEVRAISMHDAQVFLESYPDRVLGVYSLLTPKKDMEEAIREDIEAIGALDL